MTFDFDKGFSRENNNRNLDGVPRYNGRPTDAERVHRKIVCVIQECETVQELDDFYESESLVLDALFLDFPEFAEAVETAFEDHRAMLCGVFRTAQQVFAPSESRSQTASGTQDAHSAHDGKDGTERKDNECIW